MKTEPAKSVEKGGIELAGEAVHLLRTAPLHVTAAYLLGTLPFVLGFLYFWSEMSRSAFARERCITASLAMTALFVWMKSLQAVFASGLTAFIMGTPDAPWTFRRWLRVAAAETIIQPYGLVLIPVAMLLMLPFPSAYAFYHNVTILGSRETGGLGRLVRKAWQQAALWQKQNWVLIWLLCPWQLALGMLVAFGSVWLGVSMTPEFHAAQGLIWFVGALVLIYYFILPFSFLGCVIATNIAVALILAPHLLQMLFGIETVFTLSGWNYIFNSTFIITVFGLSYLFLDPIAKAAYVLRCFYGESQRSGADLWVELDALEREGRSAG